MNETDFSNMVKQYSSLIFTVCYRLVKDYHEAENLTQETFLSAYLSFDSFDGSDYKPWLIRIAVNKSKDYLKSAFCRTTDAYDNQTLDSIQSGSDYGSIEQSEEMESIKAACRKLPPPYSEIAVLHYIEDKSFEEISIILDRPLKTVQTQVYRARDKLRKALKEDMKC